MHLPAWAGACVLVLALAIEKRNVRTTQECLGGCLLAVGKTKEKQSVPGSSGALVPCERRSANQRITVRDRSKRVLCFSSPRKTHLDLSACLSSLGPKKTI